MAAGVNNNWEKDIFKRTLVKSLKTNSGYLGKKTSFKKVRRKVCDAPVEIWKSHAQGRSKIPLVRWRGAMST